MRAMIVTILIPDDWTTSDVCTACNIGIRSHAENEGKQLRAIDYNCMVIDRFQIDRKEGHQ
jgi:hypothetical protein